MVGEQPDDPHRLARLFLDGSRWYYWREGYWEFTGTHYREVPKVEVRGWLSEHCKGVFERDHEEDMATWKGACEKADRRRLADPDAKAAKPHMPLRLKVTKNLVQNVLGALEGSALLSSEFQQPSMLDGGPTPALVALKNGLLDLGTGGLRDHTPDYFNRACLPYHHDPEARCSRFMAALDRSLGGDTELIGLLQEWFGYHLLTTTDAQAMLLMVGEGANGKSMVCAALEAMLGPENVSGLSLANLRDHHTLPAAMGRLANISADMGELDRTDEGRLKMLVSGDKQLINPKHRDPYSDRSKARWTIATNSLPYFSDKSEGLYRRLLVVPFRVRIPEGERVAGMDKPAYWQESGELPGILNWALEGLARLRARGLQFKESAVCQEVKEAHRKKNNPTRTFLEEWFEEDPEAEPILSQEVYLTYQTWAYQHGHKAVASNTFAEEVRRRFPIANNDSRIKRGEDRLKVWKGLRKLQPLLESRRPG
jgi:P4 family phage/plasmid primase-like protien